MQIIPLAVRKNGLRMDDKVNFQPLQKGVRTIELKRTKYIFQSAQDLDLNFTNCVFQLPALKNENFKFELEIVSHDIPEEDGRYYLKSFGIDMFRLNGNYCREAFIERGDVVEMGFNKLYFNKEFIKKENQLEIPSAIVKSDIPILITGETGTGKTTLAKKIHEDSERDGTFVHLNLSSYSKGLIESELFGHTKGAFTGAVQEKKGALAEANRGTLFLDEIDSVGIDIQVKLLLFLEGGAFRPVGTNTVYYSKTRLIFSSGKPLEKLIEDNLIRKDFYYRLKSGHSVEMPALKNSPESIIYWCHLFERENYAVISNDLINFYSQLSWPGNVRQLYSHLKKKKILSNGKKLIYDEFDKILINENLKCESFDGKILTLEEIKYHHTLETFQKLQQNYTIASRTLGISPNTLRSILKKAA